ncbi:lactonase family protein [Ochrovirga pacifica]|uniref:lactonase family protein n=1 Tax=Ochrovirga pacifica TaxID=1042376 RepID=UPI0002558EC9|nr:lactonase family protein [Ochrovirga pacifica]
MFQKVILFAVALFFNTSFIQNSDKELSRYASFYIGTMSDATSDEKKGIYQGLISEEGYLSSIQFLASAENPTYLSLTKNNAYLLAVNSLKKGEILSFKTKPFKTGLTLVDCKLTGVGPCHVQNQSGYVLTANYSGGTMSLHRILTNGKLSKKLDSLQHFVSTPSQHKRQKQAFAHSCYFEPNSNNIISVDLGANKLQFSHIDTLHHKIVPNTFSELELPKESGPRHLAFHPKKDFMYVVNELNATVSFIKKNQTNNTYQLINTYATLPKNFKGKNTAAHIEISKDGRFLYMTNRGHESMAVFSIANNGNLHLVERVSVHGKHPRNFVITPNQRFILIANKDSDNICSFRRNVQTGTLTFIDEIKTPNPVCLLF